MTIVKDIIEKSAHIHDAEYIKVFDGIAGSAKSSAIDIEFSGQYCRYTSTVKLMKDAISRFNCPCNTIAGGLFVTERGKFYAHEKNDIDVSTIVIDEVLQSDSRVFDWCVNHKGDYNIVLTTDSRQMLPPSVGHSILSNFREFCSRPDVEYVPLVDTYRPRDTETKKLFIELYENVENNGRNMFDEKRNRFTTIKYEDMPFNEFDVYLTHTNEIEEFLYRNKNIKNLTNFEFIPKGVIAKTNATPANYPILSQAQAMRRHVTGYFQAANIGTVTRYQGSEVNYRQKCYFLIHKNSVVGNREFYTALTRCWIDSSFVIVIMPDRRVTPLKTFCGLPIKEENPLYLHSDSPEVQKISELINKENRTISTSAMVQLQAAYKGGKYAYSDKDIYIDGVHYSTPEALGPRPQGKYTMAGLLKKEPEFDFGYMEEIYTILDMYGIPRLKAPHYNGNTAPRSDFTRRLDLASAYPHILKYMPMPVDGPIYRDREPGKMPFYYYDGPLFGECIITGQLLVAIQEMIRSGRIKEEDIEGFQYIFSTDYQIGSKIGDIIVDKATKDIETKAKTKEIHWGYLEKKYIEKRFDSYYVRQSYNNHELLMVSILSELMAIMLYLSANIQGSFYICVDAVHYNGSENDEILKRVISELAPELRYRIEDGTGVVYQNFEPLMSKKDRKAAMERSRRAAKKAAKKDDSGR